MGHLPLFMHLGEFKYKFAFPEHYLIVREEIEMFSFFWYPVSDRNNDSRWELYGNYLSQLYKRKWKCPHDLGIIFVIETIISVGNYVVVAILNFLQFSNTVMCFIVRTDGITMYNFINFNIEAFYWIIWVLVTEV